MRKIICVMVVLGVAAIAAAPAQAAKHKVNATVVIANIASTGTLASGSVDYAGSIKGSIGSGAILGHNDFGPTLGEFQGTNKVFYNKGTLKTALEGTGAPNAEGGLTVSGTGHYTKGTGKYKGAKGHLTFEGTTPANSNVTTLTVTGSLKY
jgi:hypothetical protein